MNETQQEKLNTAAGEQPAAVTAADEAAKESAPERREKRAGRRAMSTELSFASLKASLNAKLHRTQRDTRRLIGDARSHKFPESNHFIVQLILLLVGLLPMLTSIVRETMRSIYRFLHRPSEKRIAGHWRGVDKKYHPLIFAGVAAVIAVCAVFFSHFTFATVVSYNGEEVAAVESRSAAKRVVSLAEAVTGETTGTAFTFEEDAVHYSFALVGRDEMSTREELQRELTEEVGLVSYGYSLIVNDEVIGSTVYAGALESLLDQLKEIYSSPDTLTIDFLEDVRIAEGYVPTESIMNLGQIAEIVNSTKSGEVTYTVVKGDTWGKIAGNNGMSNSELELLNPGYNINKLSIGDVLTISNAVPYLTVRVTERQNYTEDIQYEISYEDDSSMYQGDYRVISKGAYGTADVVADVVYVNGVEQERTVLSSVTLTEPVTEYRAQGTKPRPSWFPTGSFRWPTTGRITSYFGYRNTGIRGASTNHKGIDIACRYGTPIYAADGGTVSYSGWWGAGGYTVIIDHGNGYKTYYEHNSSLLVKKGAHVYKGQQIARAGSTGVSSGNHCHFGIMKNGTYVNPLKYLP